MSREEEQSGVEAMTKKNGVAGSDPAQLAAAMSDLDETLLLHGSVVSQSAELMSLVGDQFDQQVKSLTQLMERAERCAGRIEQLPSPPAWRWALIGVAWAFVGGLAAGAVSGVANLVFQELAR